MVANAKRGEELSHANKGYHQPCHQPMYTQYTCGCTPGMVNHHTFLDCCKPYIPFSLLEPFGIDVWLTGLCLRLRKVIFHKLAEIANIDRAQIGQTQRKEMENNYIILNTHE